MNKKVSYLLIAIILVIAVVIPASAQFGIGTTSPDPSAALDIVSTNQGVLHPRLTTAQRDAISSPAEGLTIYNTTDKCLQVYDGTAWNCAVGGNGSGTTEGIPQMTGATYPLLSVAAAPSIRVRTDASTYRNSSILYPQAGWLSNQRFGYVYQEISGATTTIVIKIYDEGLHEIDTFTYSIGAYDPVTISSDIDDNIIVFFSSAVAGEGSATYYMVVDPSDGTVVHSMTKVETPSPLYGSASRYRKVIKLTDGTFAILNELNNTQFALYLLAGDYTVTGTALSEPANNNYGDHKLIPTSFGYFLFRGSYSGIYPALDYSAHNPDGSILKSVAPVTADNTSMLYNVQHKFSVIANGNDLYLMAASATPNTYVISKLTYDNNGMLTPIWEKELPYPTDALEGGTAYADGSGVLEMHPNGNLMVNLAPIANTPIGFYQDGTLAATGQFRPIVFYNVSDGSIVKTVSIDSPAQQTNWGEGRWEPHAYNYDGGHQLFTSPDGQQIVYVDFYTGYKGSATVVDQYWRHLSVLDPETLESIYTLTTDNVAHPIEKRFMIYDMNENITKVEIVVAVGNTGDVLDIDPDLTLPSGITKAYDAGLKKLTVSGTSNTADEFKNVLNGLTFATTAASGERTLEATIFDGDGNENTATFTIPVGN